MAQVLGFTKYLGYDTGLGLMQGMVRVQVQGTKGFSIFYIFFIDKIVHFM